MNNKKIQGKLFNNRQSINRFAFLVYLFISHFVTLWAYVISVYATDSVINWTVIMLLMSSCFVFSSFLLLMSGEYKNTLKEYNLNRIIKVALLIMIKAMIMFLVLATFVSTSLGNSYMELLCIGVFLDLVLCTVLSITARKSIIRLHGKYKLSKKYL